MKTYSCRRDLKRMEPILYQLRLKTAKFHEEEQFEILCSVLIQAIFYCILSKSVDWLYLIRPFAVVIMQSSPQSRSGQLANLSIPGVFISIFPLCIQLYNWKFLGTFLTLGKFINNLKFCKRFICGSITFAN